MIRNKSIYFHEDTPFQHSGLQRHDILAKLGGREAGRELHLYS